VSGSTTSVIIGGETGTGKEILARSIHELSRRSGEFVAVNCGALPETLIEAELFGVKRGAFTGAKDDRPGLIRSADKGTLFLDEIGELPPAAQTTLLRVLDQQSVVPIGGTKPMSVDFRVISATLRNLDAMVSEGRFRSDLLARLGVVRVVLPLLRERREDMGILIGATLRKILKVKTNGIAFTLPAARALMLHDWPLNVRELHKCLEAATAQAKGQAIDLEHLPSVLQDGNGRKPSEAVLHRLLTQYEGNVSKVAMGMGLGGDRKAVYRLCEEFGLDPGDYRKPKK
jgi:sigma-54 dependent transcriptional regulator, acetoin dehydrogenase operon transcriptional activator AcoR